MADSSTGPSPIFIWEASAYSGARPLGEVLTSSDDRLVFGLDQLHFSVMLQLWGQFVSTGDEPTEEAGMDAAATVDERLAAFADGDYTIFANDLVPPENTALVVRAFHQARQLYEQTADDSNCDQWGVIGGPLHPDFTAVDPQADDSRGRLRRLEGINQLFPNCQHLLVYRNIYDVLSSMKGGEDPAPAYYGNVFDDFPRTDSGDTWAFFPFVCAFWEETLREVRDHVDRIENFTAVKFEELLGSEDNFSELLDAIAAPDRAPTDSIDEHALETAADEWLPHEPLTERELELVEAALSGQLLEELDYRPPDDRD